MNFKKPALAIVSALVAQFASASEVTISISGISSLYPQVDTMLLSFDDSSGASPVPYWLNGFVSGSATTGYAGTLRSSISSYQAPVYVGFTQSTDFYLFQECSLAVKCYLALTTATNGVPYTINPRNPGQLGAFFQENLQNLVTFAGPNAGWNVSYNSLPNFPETFPWLQVAKPSSIAVTAIPEPSTILSLLGGGALLWLLRGRANRRAEA